MNGRDGPYDWVTSVGSTPFFHFHGLCTDGRHCTLARKWNRASIGPAAGFDALDYFLGPFSTPH